MDFMDLAKSRYSERFFDPRPVEQEKLDQILEAGRIVPTACNYQPQRFYVLKSPEALAALMQPEPTAAKSAKAIIEYNSRVVKTKDEIEGRITNFAKFLEDISVGQLQNVSPAAVENFQRILETFNKLLNSVETPQ